MYHGGVHQYTLPPAMCAIYTQGEAYEVLLPKVHYGLVGTTGDVLASRIVKSEKNKTMQQTPLQKSFLAKTNQLEKTESFQGSTLQILAGQQAYKQACRNCTVSLTSAHELQTVSRMATIRGAPLCSPMISTEKRRVFLSEYISQKIRKRKKFCFSSQGFPVYSWLFWNLQTLLTSNSQRPAPYPPLPFLSPGC